MPLTHRVVAALAGSTLLVTGYLGTAAVAEAAPRAAAASDCSDAGPTLRYLVIFDHGTSEQDAAGEITANCGSTTVYYPQIGVGVVTSPDSRFADRIGPDRAYSAAGEALNSDGTGTHRTRPNLDATPIRRSSGLSGTDRTPEQWDMAMIQADRAHRISNGSSNVVVGVLDSGVDAGHPDLRKAVDPSLSAGCTTGKPDQSPTAWAPTTSGHGTHVAGTIAAADDGQGITGVAPGVRLASVKVVDNAGFIYPESAVCGYMWAAAHQFTLTNNSYFIDPWLFTCRSEPGQRVVHEAVRRAIDYATGHGVLTIAAAGNDGLDLANPEQDSTSPDNAADPQTRPVDNSCDVLPAELKGVVAVSAVGAAKLKSGYSSYGLGVADVTAPGGDRGQKPGSSGNGCVLSTVPGGYGYSCGTSMATPHVAGVAALLASSHPSADPAQLTQLLNGNADPVPCPNDYDLNGDGAQDAICNGYSSYNGFYGHGLVNALDAANP